MRRRTLLSSSFLIVCPIVAVAGNGTGVFHEVLAVEGSCPADTLRLCLPHFWEGIPGDTVCTGVERELNIITFPRYRDVDTGCTMRTLRLLPPSSDLSAGWWQVCLADCPESFLRYEFAGVASDDPSLDCDRTPPFDTPGPFADDDGDGFIDEEWPNGLDDDGDGVVDEDLRCEIQLLQPGFIPVRETTWSWIKSMGGY